MKAAELRDRVGLVTGAGHGIGRGIARALAGAGVRLALVDRDEGALAGVVSELSPLTPAGGFALDVRDREAFERTVDQIEDSLGPVALLFNNAGVMAQVPVAEMTYEMWDWGLGINLGGVINGVQTVLPRMLARGGPGHIVNTASASGLAVPGPRGGTGFLYGTAKYAVVGMSECLRGELEEYGIGVSVLCPGPVATSLHRTSSATRPGNGAAPDEDLDAREASLHAKGASPDEVGRRVLQGIVNNDLFIHTDRVILPYLEERMAEIVKTMPGR